LVIELKPRFPEAVSPASWGAIVNYDSKNWTPWNPDKFVLHWGGGKYSVGSAVDGNVDGEQAVIQGWERYHKYTKGWLGIAYNWAIGNSGTLYRLRGDNRSGAQAGDDEPDGIPENHEAIAVVFLVNTPDQVSEAAFATFRAMFARVPEIDTVIGHKDIDIGPGYGTSTTCPGPQISAFIATKSYEEGVTEMALSKGAKGKAVEHYQEALLAWDSNALPKYGADADFGGETETWVKTFQAAWDLAATGVIDGVTGDLLSQYENAGSGDHEHDDQYAKKVHGHGAYSTKDHGHTATTTIT
jgi:peptidoglycan hydrolase-like protein with peptidoglycan-binding domain